MLNPLSVSSSSVTSYDEFSELYRDSKLEAAIRWIIYAINFALAIVGQCVILIGLVLTDTVGLINPDKLGYTFRGIVYLFVITGVVTILISITGGGWFCVHQSLLLRIHLALTAITILLYLMVITVIAIRSTEDNAALYLSRCWDDYVIRNKTIDLMELQIRFKCCGQNNISDYIEYDYVLKMSCYENFNQQLAPFENNCRTAVEEFFTRKRNVTIVISSLIIIMMGIYLLLCNFLYHRRLKTKKIVLET